jgi:SAM-dependent methyltransferase
VRLGALKRHWERLGRQDPFWAALTHHDKAGRRWDADAFFRSGIEELGAALERAERLGITVSRDRALDFGSGAGRLTQAMARQFVRSDGVDISASMLAAAARHNRFPDRCFYHLNAAPDLSLFADGTFSFIYSTLVLQHMEPRYSTGYIRELLRVLAPGGLLVFQVPGHHGAIEPSQGDVRTPSAGRLPAGGFRARLLPDPTPFNAPAGELLNLTVTVENRSTQLWPALPDSNGRFQIKLGNHWLHQNGRMLQRDDGRSPLPHDLTPGERVKMVVGVRAPQWDGDYWIELDLVQENISWFAEKGSPTARVACRVTGGLPPFSLSDAPPRAGAVEGVKPDVRFRDRHPRIFRVLFVMGLRDAYWTWRRILDRVRARRDRVIVAVREFGSEPVVSRLINWWRSRPFAARMEMHCVPRSEVLAIVQEQGGRVVDTEEEMIPGGLQSYRYWISKS